METLGIIGFGNFGQFAASHLKDHFDVTIHDARDIRRAADRNGVKNGSLKQSAGCDVVLLCVPVQDMEKLLLQITPHLKNGALVADVASVKQKPAALMQSILPKSCQLIGTHPLFGPQSGKDSIRGLQVVVCPVRAEKKTTEKFYRFLQQLGLQVLDMTPQEHDEWMARTQAIAHMIGRTAKEMELPQAPFKLATYDALLSLRDLVKDDSNELFQTIQQENPYAETERRKLMVKLEELERVIRKPRRGA